VASFYTQKMRLLPPNPMDALLAVDGGGTTTRCVIADDTLDVLVSVSG